MGLLFPTESEGVRCVLVTGAFANRLFRSSTPLRAAHSGDRKDGSLLALFRRQNVVEESEAGVYLVLGNGQEAEMLRYFSVDQECLVKAQDRFEDLIDQLGYTEVIMAVNAEPINSSGRACCKCGGEAIWELVRDDSPDGSMSSSTKFFACNEHVEEELQRFNSTTSGGWQQRFIDPSQNEGEMMVIDPPPSEQKEDE